MELEYEKKSEKEDMMLVVMKQTLLVAGVSFPAAHCDPMRVEVPFLMNYQ